MFNIAIDCSMAAAKIEEINLEYINRKKVVCYLTTACGVQLKLNVTSNSWLGAYSVSNKALRGKRSHATD